ncbi:MAG: 23S rRNA (uracil(1939)-C(5))-methyltransferase RlmD [Nitrolancea sp.]
MGRSGKRDRGGTARRHERVDVQLPRFDSDGTITVQVGGRSVAVSSGIPTETVRLALNGSGKHWRGDVIAVLDRAAERDTPRCPVVDSCGGCEWQHLNHEGQLKHKAAIVRRLMAAKRLPTRIDEIVPMPDPWSYRVRAQIALGASAGFREIRSKRIVRLLGCPVVHPAIDWLLEQLNRLLKLNELPDFGGKLIVHAQVVGQASDRRLQLLLEGVDGHRIESADQLRETADVLSQLERVESICVRDTHGEIEALYGELFTEIEIGGRTYTVPAGSFFQSNFQLLPKLLDRVRELATLDGSQRVADIYGGIGLLGLSIADQAASLTIIEIDELATEAGERTAQNWGLNNVSFMSASAEEAILSLPEVDRVIVDPPRTGLDRQVVDTLIQRAPPIIVYVSCNPATFARDAAHFVRAGYSIEHFSLWDFYPQTVHVETVAKLVRSTAMNERFPGRATIV